MNTTDLQPLIRACVDGETTPISSGEIRARAALGESLVRRVPSRRRSRFALAGTGLAAAGIAAALVVAQTGGTAAGGKAVLTDVVIRHLATASRTAMTSGQADIYWISAGSASVTQHIGFDGDNYIDTIQSVGGPPVKGPLHAVVWHGKTIDEVVDGQTYHYPAIVWKPKAHFAAGWMRVGTGGSLDIPDPRTFLDLLSPSAGFVSDGYTTVNGTRVEHLRATTPQQIPLTPLNDVIQSEPDSPRISALDLWVSTSGVVVEARVTVTGTDGAPVTVTVMFSHTGQPQQITVPAHYTNFG